MTRKIPIRKCIGCSAQAPKSELIRVVRTPEGEIVLDTTGKVNGRGAYLCPKKECLKKAIRANRLKSALDTEIPAQTLEELAKKIGQE